MAGPGCSSPPESRAARAASGVGCRLGWPGATSSSRTSWCRRRPRPRRRSPAPAHPPRAGRSPGWSRRAWSGPPGDPPSSATLGIRELPGDVAAGLAVGDVATAVVELLSASESEFELCPAAGVQVEAERNDRLALRLRPAEELVDLRAVEQELAGPLRLVVVAIAL